MTTSNSVSVKPRRVRTARIFHSVESEHASRQRGCSVGKQAIKKGWMRTISSAGTGPTHAHPASTTVCLRKRRVVNKI
jgi:hypothetical protein